MPAIARYFYSDSARWYIQAVRKLMIEGVDISLVLTEIGTDCYGGTLITVSFKKFNNRLE